MEAGEAAVQEKKPRRSVTIKEEAGGVKDKAKKSFSAWDTRASCPQK